MLVLIAAATGTALATGLGAIPVFFLGERAAVLRPALLGLAAGAMTVASISGLLLPGLDQGSAIAVGGGVVVGVLFLLIARQRLEPRSDLGGQHWGGERGRASLLVFVVLFVHSLPEGFAIGTAYASDTAGLSLFVILAIAMQNIPEGTSIAIPMAAAGFSRARQFWAAVATSAPQPVGAVVAYLLVREVGGLLPFSFGFAAGAMLALVVVEVLPTALRGNRRAALAGAATGAAAMLGLSAALGV
jgi:zinc transporter, ZIP family